MRISFFTETFLPKYDGVVTAVISLSKELARLGNEILIFAPEPKKRLNLKPVFGEVFKKIKVVYLPSTPDFLYPDFRFSSPALLLVIKKLRKFKTDIIHFHSPGPAGILAVISAKILNKPLVGTFHTYFMEPEYLRLVRMQDVKPVKNFLWKFSNFLHDRANLTICPSRYSADDLKKQGVKSLIVTIPNGIELLPQKGVKATLLKKKYGMPKYNLLYVGRISKEKNLDILISTLPLVKKEISEFKLNLIGDGPIISDLLKLAIKEKVSANINFFGPMKHEELLNSGIYQVSDLFITPSTSETQCISAVEAMMFGLPLVVAKAKGLEELISGNGIAVFPVNKKRLAEAVLKILKNEDWRKKMGEWSKKLALNFDIKKTAKKTFEEYQKLLKPKKPGLFARFFKRFQEVSI